MNWTKGLFRLWVLYSIIAVAFVAQLYLPKIQLAFSPIPKVRFVYPLVATQPQKSEVLRGVVTMKVTLSDGLKLHVEAETKSEAKAIVEKLIADGEAETMSELARADVFVGVILDKPIVRFPMGTEKSVAKGAMLKEFAKETSLTAKAQVFSRLIADMLIWVFSPLFVFVCLRWVWRGFRTLS